MKQINKVAVIGAGALGILYGNQMSEALGKENVCFVADSERVRRYEADGFYCNGKACDLRFVEKGKVAETADLVLFSVKYTALPEAIESAKQLVGDDTLILSVLNGIVSERDIASVYGEEKLLYTIAQGSDALREGNRVSFSKNGILQVGTKSGGRDERLKAVLDLLDRSGIEYVVPEDIMHQMWNKLMFNTGVNQVTAAFETNYGGVQKPGMERDNMVKAMKEVQAVAVHEGVVLTDEEIEEWLQVLDGLSPQSMPSMRQDTLAHRKTEVELFSGTIRALGNKYGVPTEMNDYLYKRIKEIEANY